MKNPENILVVEDEADLRTIIQISLGQIGGFNVKLAGCGNEAINLLDTFTPDILVTDIMMPGMTGIELAKYFLTQEKYKNIPLVFMTAKMQVQEIESYQNEFTKCSIITKPFDPVALPQEIINCWEKFHGKQ